MTDLTSAWSIHLDSIAYWFQIVFIKTLERGRLKWYLIWPLSGLFPGAVSPRFKYPGVPRFGGTLAGLKSKVPVKLRLSACELIYLGPLLGTGFIKHSIIVRSTVKTQKWTCVSV